MLVEGNLQKLIKIFRLPPKNSKNIRVYIGDILPLSNFFELPLRERKIVVYADHNNIVDESIEHNNSSYPICIYWDVDGGYGSKDCDEFRDVEDIDVDDPYNLLGR